MFGKQNFYQSLKSSSQTNQNGTKKEWDSRFYLDKLPAYNAHSDKNCKFKSLLRY